jgi:hypothetical protein
MSRKLYIHKIINKQLSIKNKVYESKFYNKKTKTY